MKLIITGGHHSSALPVISILNKEHPDVEIFWIGHRHTLKNDKNDTLEYQEITQMGIPFYDLHAGKFYNTYNPLKLIKIPIGFIESLRILFRLKPDLIMSFGGYIGVPVVIAGWLLGIPAITHEQTVVSGYANRLIGLFAKKILISWKSSKKYFNESKVVYTGLPLRKEIKSTVTNNFVTENNLPLILIMGGKTGSHFINTVVLESMQQLLAKYNIVHQCGDYSQNDDFKVLSNRYEAITNLPGKYFLRKFIFRDEIGEAFSKCALAVSRSGAHTILELLVLHKPALLVPIPWVSHNEQYENAKLLKNLGLAEIVEENDFTPGHFVEVLDNMFSKIADYRLKANVNLLTDAETRIVHEIISLHQKQKKQK